MRTDPLLRALGADPQVFHPVYHAQRLMLSRPRLLQARGRTTGSGFLVGLVASINGVVAATLLLTTRLPVLGGGLALTFCCAFLLMIVLADHAEALVRPGERLVLAAHPHDDRSLLLAKLAAAGRSLAPLAACLFLPPCLVVAFRWPPGAALAFLAGAAGAALAVATFGLLAAVLLVRLGGRRAMDRLLPWIRLSFQLGYILPMASNRMLLPERLSAGTRTALSWLLPTFWFTAPFELAAGGAGPAAVGRLALAAGSLVAVGIGGWRLAAGLGRRLLEPEPRPAAAPGRRAPRSPGILALLVRFEGLRLLSLLRVHLRSDWRASSELLSLPIVTLFMVFLFSRQASIAGGEAGFFMYGFMIVVSADSLTRSQRPESLWWLLSSPIDRTRFSLATIPLLRLLLLVPVSAAVALLSLRHPGAAAVSWEDGFLLLFALLAYGDLLLVLGKALFPEFPFSCASSGPDRSSERRFGRMLIGMPVSGAGTAAFIACRHFGVSGIAFGGLVAVLLHLPAFLWARARTRRAAARLDLALLG